MYFGAAVGSRANREVDVIAIPLARIRLIIQEKHNELFDEIRDDWALRVQQAKV